MRIAMLELNPESHATLRRWLSDDEITTLVERVSVIANRPPPPVPTLKIAMAQLEQIDAAAKALQAALEDAPWVCDALERRAPGKFSDALLLRRLADARAAVRLAAADFPHSRAEGAELQQGNRADAMVRAVLVAVLQSLDAKGVRLSQTGTGAAGTCAQVVIDALAGSNWVSPQVAELFHTVNAGDRLRTLLGGPRKRTKKSAKG
jgi:hypothetical protein